jgi:hypothetical protein
MALAAVMGKVVFVEVMIEKGYCDADRWTIRILRAKQFSTDEGLADECVRRYVGS